MLENFKFGLILPSQVDETVDNPAIAKSMKPWPSSGLVGQHNLANDDDKGNFGQYRAAEDAFA
jgi:hypothetical protein